MDKQTLTLTIPEKQPEFSAPVELSPADRYLLLTSTLELFLQRLYHGCPVTRADLFRLARYVDA